MKKYILLGLILGVVGTLAATRAVTQITRSAPAGNSSELMAYQGRITDSQGRPVEGTHDLGFKIYEDSVPIWGPQDFPNVPVNHGVFNLFLGGSAAPLPDFATDKTYELEITVDGTVLPQKQLIGTVPLAKMAGKVSPGSVTQVQAPTLLRCLTNNNVKVQYGMVYIRCDGVAGTTYSADVTFPDTFTETPMVYMTPAFSGAWYIPSATNISTTGFRANAACLGTTTTGDLPFQWIAIGK
jgi:hypothetical protein